MTNNCIHLFEFGDYQPLPDSMDLPSFKAYLKDVWNNRQLFYEQAEENQTDSEEQQADQRRQGQALLQFDGRDVRARNYAGFIQYQNTTIHILPKIFKGTGITESKIFQHLLFYLSYAAPRRFPFSCQSSDPTSQDNFLQILIHLFAAYTEKTLAEHPYHMYEEIGEISPFVRGKLDMPAYMRQGLSNGQWQELQVRHSPFLYDNTFNQLIKYTVELLIPVVSAKTLPLLHQILFMLDEVSNNTYSYQDCEKLENSNLPQEHGQVLALCKVFLANQHIESPQANGSCFSFLVPMEKVFEDFVGGFLKRHFQELNIQMQSTTSFATLNGHTAFRIRNDIWLPKTSTVIDTKYKLLDLTSKDLQNGILQSDLYQMLAYAIQRKSTHVHLIYPLNNQQMQESYVVTIDNIFNGETIQIHIHQIPMIISNTSNPDNASMAERLVYALKERFNTILYV